MAVVRSARSAVARAHAVPAARARVVPVAASRRAAGTGLFAEGALGALLAAAALLAACALLAASARAQPAPPRVAMASVAGAGPILDATAFAGAEAATVPLLPQVITTPREPKPSVTSITVRAVRNRDHAGFLLEWSDASADWRTGMDRFGDMVALAFPAKAGSVPAPFMGNPGGRVQILQWRADWQSDLERGPISLAELYPNAYGSDYYPEDRLPAEQARGYRGAAGLGNPMSAAARRSAVQDLAAEGFGSLTPLPAQSAEGKGSHDGEGWRVVVTRPLAGDGESSASLAPGTTTLVAFAVWDGAHREVGARKSWASWVALEVAK
jgi:hypothetical protein